MSAMPAELLERYGVGTLHSADVVIPPPELFRKRPAWVVRRDGGALRLDVMPWGFPHMVAGRSGKPLAKAVTNIRNYASPFWRSALADPTRRCFVPVTAFSEYGPGVPGHLPLRWFDVPSRPIFSFAGVWRLTVDGAVFAFLTCKPNALVAPIHPKAMPVVLDDQGEDAWLRSPVADALSIATPFPSQLMAAVAA